MTRLAVVLLLLVSLVCPVRAQDSAQEVKNCGTPDTIGDDWSLATPAEVGLDASILCGLDKFLTQWPAANIHAVVVARHGKLALERYYNGRDERFDSGPIGQVAFKPETKHDLRSISKSVVSLLVGIALGEGLFPPLDSSVLDALPEYADLRTPERSKITFRHLLTMTPGIAWDETYVPSGDAANSSLQMRVAVDPVRYVLEQPIVARAGKDFVYSGGTTTLLAAVLVRTTGRRLDEYAREKLFSPLGIGDFEWMQLWTTREPSAASGLRLRPRDLAKLGQLMVADGVWNGRQLVPKGWAIESVQPRIGTDGLYYFGYQWWLGRTYAGGRSYNWAAGLGYGGQALYMQPDLGLVVSVNSGHYSGPNSWLQRIIPLAIFNQVIMPAVKD
jgi:CubicO group peptidase (beta-lactamase class C family)